MTDEHQKKVEEKGNPSKATGASGGGSFGNQSGAPVTGGAPEDGQRGDGDVHPSPDAVRGGDRASELVKQPDHEGGKR
ncbi:hypothetical protein [Paraburkholderia sp.]|jgi:hypothetical protein|uniref:hypothetical protein n=1 Tax=Paraburkholderia sp. TaxID=1926495 RepID=UPI002F42FEEE